MHRCTPLARQCCDFGVRVGLDRPRLQKSDVLFPPKTVPRGRDPVTLAHRPTMAGALGWPDATGPDSCHRSTERSAARVVCQLLSLLPSLSVCASLPTHGQAIVPFPGVDGWLGGSEAEKKFSTSKFGPLLINLFFAPEETFSDVCVCVCVCV